MVSLCSENMHMHLRRWCAVSQTKSIPRIPLQVSKPHRGVAGKEGGWLADETFILFTALTIYRHVVIDEVDRMLDMGFAQSVEDIIEESYRNGCK